jgi:hypothetical protein
VHFFDDPHRFNQGIEFYAKRFHHCTEDTDNKHKQIILDATPNYLNQAKNVHKVYTDTRAGDAIIKLKLIVILREPIDRELSWYNHKLSMYNSGLRDHWITDVTYHNGTIKSFDQYTSSLAKEIRKDPRKSFSLYVDHLKTWVELFDRRHLLLLSYDEMLKNPSKFQSRIESFLGITLHGDFVYSNTNEFQTKVRKIPDYAIRVLEPLFDAKNSEVRYLLFSKPL